MYAQKRCTSKFGYRLCYSGRMIEAVTVYFPTFFVGLLVGVVVGIKIIEMRFGHTETDWQDYKTKPAPLDDDFLDWEIQMRSPDDDDVELQ